LGFSKSIEIASEKNEDASKDWSESITKLPLQSIGISDVILEAKLLQVCVTVLLLLVL